jgi:hypothetical protein
VSRWARRLWDRLSGVGVLPDNFAGRLEPGEHVLAVAAVHGSGHLVASPLGLWLPEGEQSRRVGWHLVTKATWGGGALTITEAEEVGVAGSAVLLNDRTPRRYALAEAGRLPDVVHARVNRSIRSSHYQDLPGGGAWFVQRRVPGRDGTVLQARVDQDADPVVVADIAAEVARHIDSARSSIE